ncbi:amino acid adenylation domain-containing protein [Streptomyces sp. NPDC057137]|uniref:amino acid adenylation domain-containing protein n=1 Tax=Streptomyces sp. NPDC057137 TaxID=3346030 RepID=UPI00363E5AAF
MPVMLPELILDSIRRYPDSPAVIAGDRVVSYRELAARARQVAAALRATGLGTESTVGILMAPGPGLVTALVGSWMAGACYVPVDPLAPVERQAWLIELAGLSALLTDSRSAVAAFGAQLPVIRVDAPNPVPGAATAAGASAGSTPPRSAAYMMFTSGSTGTPKRVVVEHAAIANRVRWGIRAFGMTAEDRFLQKTPLTFDPAVSEIMTPLVTGAPVVFGRPDAGQDAAALVASLAETGATVVQVVPSMLRLLAVEPGLEDCHTLRVVISAGEPLHAELFQQVRTRMDVEIWNAYGPTECTIDVTAARCGPEQRTGPMPIGHPIDNVHVRLIPAGTEPGETRELGAPHPADTLFELYVGGAGVARGYDKDPARTAERFLPDPLGLPGARMYRTGDLVRQAADGSLTFAGRVDAQMKINGVRIEPGDVESVLERHPQVVAAAVAPLDDSRGHRRLGAWIVTADGDEPDSLMTFLRSRLPASLVPSVVTTAVELPVLTSGKIDRSRLPEPAPAGQPSASGSATTAAAVPARDPDPDPDPDGPVTAEQALVLAAWREVLGIDQVALHDDFFRLGGHSLLIAKLAAVLAETSGVAPEFRELHLHATPRAQAQLLVEAVRARPIEALPEGARIPLSPGQERFWVQDRMDPGSGEYLLPVMLWISADISELTLRRAVGHLVARHEPLRTRYAMDAAGLHAVVLPVSEPHTPEVTGSAPTEPGFTPDFEAVDTTPPGVVGQVRAALKEGFDLASAPPARYRLIRDGGDEQLLLVVSHHIAGDGWSVRLLERDLRELIEATHADRPATLPVLPVRYRDAVAWQRRLLTPQVVAEQLGHWRRTLDGVPPLVLPGSPTRQSFRDIEGAAVETAVPADVASALLAVARDTGASAHTLFLTLWTVLLARSGGAWDFGVGTPHVGRDRTELLDVVGLFINVVVIRAGLTPDMPFRVAVERVGRVHQESIAQALVPFEQVSDAVEPDRDRSRTPVFQTLFSLTGDGLVGQEVGDRDLRILSEAWRVARTDVALTLWPRAAGGFGGLLEYAVNVVPEGTALDLAEQFQTLARRFAAAPDTAVGAGFADEPGTNDGAAAVEDPEAPPLAATVLDIVREVLQQDDVGVDDDVLSRGGNSLKVARLLWSVQNIFDVEVSMRTFFDDPTAAALIGEVERLLVAQDASAG